MPSPEVWLPSALDRWDEIATRLAGCRPALFLDYDGTLAPIAPRPELAILSDETRSVLRRLASQYPVAILSGRGRDDVAAHVNLPNLTYAGSHGFDIAGPVPSVRLEVGEGIPEKIERAAQQVQKDLQGIDGLLVEPKRFAASIHFRQVDEKHVPTIENAVDHAVATTPGLRKGHGKKLFELRPDLDWDKGQALLWLLNALSLDHPGFLPFYIGDDLTDEDAFQALGNRGVGILVAEEPRETAAGYRLRHPGEVLEVLERLASHDSMKVNL